jgi:hypothetical protein
MMHAAAGVCQNKTVRSDRGSDYNRSEMERTMDGQPDRVTLAQQLYREFYGRCFWHSPPDLVITEELIPFVIKGLRDNGGWSGFVRSASLKSPQADSSGVGEVQ